MVYKYLTAFFLVMLFGLCCAIPTTYAQTPTEHQKDSLLNNWQSIPGTSVKMIPPAYFKPFEKDGKFGFIHEGAAASIMVQEIDKTPYVIAVEGFTKEYIEGQGLKYISREDVKTKDGKDAVIISVGFTLKSGDGSQEVEYERLMLFTGDHTKTIWVQGNYPVLVKKVLYLVIRESLLSVKF